MKDDLSESAEMLESVGAAGIQHDPEPDKTDKTTFRGEEESQEQIGQVIRLHKWPPEEINQFPAICEMLKTLCGRFFPRKHLIALAQSELLRCDVDTDRAEALAAKAVDVVLGYWSSQTDDLQWGLRLRVIFKDKYPSRAREYWVSGGIAERRYERQPSNPDMPASFQIEHYENIKNPGKVLATKIAPDLFVIEAKGKEEETAKPTADLERFQNAEKAAVPRSNLFEVIVFGRPTWRVKTGWEPYNPLRLPRMSVAAKLTCAFSRQETLIEFVDDLKATFAWPDDGSLGAYLGYLVQPMVSHLYVGQMPAYCFLGPTKAGKGYLSNALPSVLYSRMGEPTVMTKQITPSSYELEVLLNASKDAIYICFDEVKSATEDEIKLIDAFCTQATIMVRKFRHGYIEIDNHFTLSMTAVNRTFTDETYGRLAVIKLRESRPESISSFHRRWCRRGPELLRSLYDAVNVVDIDLETLPKVTDRRPGFGLMAHVTKSVFGLDPDYSVESSNNDTLDDLCRMHEEEQRFGRNLGSWTQYALRNFTDYMNQKHEIRWKRSNALAAINTSLGYTSTRNHPSYREVGYEAESKKRYHIELREEGQKSKRTFIYMREATQPEA